MIELSSKERKVRNISKNPKHVPKRDAKKLEKVQQPRETAILLTLLSPAT